jgi:hypothetical protein
MVDNPYSLYCYQCSEMQRQSYCFHVLLIAMRMKNFDPTTVYWSTTFTSFPKPATQTKSHKVFQRRRYTGPQFRGIHTELGINEGVFPGLDYLASRSIGQMQKLLKLQYRGIELNKFYVTEQ